MSTHGWRYVGLAAATLVGVALVATGAGPRAGAGPTTTVAPTTTRPATTTAAQATTTAVLPTLPEPADADSDPVRTLVPSIVAYGERLESEAERQAAVASALNDGTNTVAVEAAPAMLCSIVPVTTPLMASGRWERNGDQFASDEMIRRDPPGYGDCVVAGDDERFDDGVYQYIAVGPTGATSAAATVVVGARPVRVWLLNNGDTAVCLVQASPDQADYYESYQPNRQVRPGEAVAVRLADTATDVRVYGCPPDEVLRSFDLSPQFGVYVDLLGSEEQGAPTPSGVSVTSTTPRPTTTG
jgi:hypothetical protein